MTIFNSFDLGVNEKKPLHIRIDPPYTTVDEGNSVEFTCIVSDQTSAIQWSSSRGEILYRQTQGNRLIFSHLR